LENTLIPVPQYMRALKPVLKRASEELIEKWEKAASDMKASIEKNFWRDEAGRFIRSVRTKLNPWGSEHSPYTTVIKVNEKGYFRDVTLEDWTIDVSLLGVSIPFGVFDVHDERVKKKGL